MHSGADAKALHAGQVMKLPDPPLTMPVASIDRYTDLFTGMCIGLVPLSSASFNEAKSAIKGMEYAASGIPFVASPSPEYRWLQETHDLGLVARKPAQWTKHLERLVDPEERARLGRVREEEVAVVAGPFRFEGPVALAGGEGDRAREVFDRGAIRPR